MIVGHEVQKTIVVNVLEMIRISERICQVMGRVFIGAGYIFTSVSAVFPVSQTRISQNTNAPVFV